MAERVIVRLARSSDRAGVEALLAAADLPLDGLADRFPASYAVAEAGSAGTYGANRLLRSVVVSPESRGRGLGERLVRERLASAAAQGLGTLYPLTTTAPAYFLRLGFRSAERADVPAAVREPREFSSVCPPSASLHAPWLPDAVNLLREGER